MAKALNTQKQNQEIKQEKSFKAKRMPIFAEPKMKAKPTSLTEPAPFSLTSVQRSNLDKQKKQQKATEIEEKERKEREFKALSLPNFERLRHLVLPSCRSSTVASRPKFASDALPKKAAPMKIDEPEEDKEADTVKNFVF